MFFDEFFQLNLFIFCILFLVSETDILKKDVLVTWSTMILEIILNVGNNSEETSYSK